MDEAWRSCAGSGWAQRTGQRRDAAAVGEHVAVRGPALWRSAWLLTGDAQRAEDLVQTALVKCWRHWDRIAVDGSVDGDVRRALITTYTAAVGGCHDERRWFRQVDAFVFACGFLVWHGWESHQGATVQSTLGELGLEWLS